MTNWMGWEKCGKSRGSNARRYRCYSKSRSVRDVIEWAVARYELTATGRALFRVAIGNMELAFYHTAVAACVFVRTPVLCFIAVAHSTKHLPIKRVGNNPLGCFDLLGPAVNHRHAAIKDFLRFNHMRRNFAPSRSPLKLNLLVLKLSRQLCPAFKQTPSDSSEDKAADVRQVRHPTALHVRHGTGVEQLRQEPEAD